MYSAHDVIAILVDRLGGDVTITDQELAATGLTLEAFKDPTQFAYKLRTWRTPTVEEVAAEIIRSAVPIEEYFAGRDDAPRVAAIEPAPTRHDNEYCADSNADEPEGYGRACIDGTYYVPCGDECCPGACTDVGPCPCCCHREGGDNG